MTAPTCCTDCHEPIEGEPLRLAREEQGLTMLNATDKLEAAVEMGRRGGIARARNLTKSQRKAAAKKAAKARWKGHKKRKLNTATSKDFVDTE